MCALSEGNEKATQFNERTQMAKCPAGRTAFRVSALLKVEMPKCASPKRGTENTKSRDSFFTVFIGIECPDGSRKQKKRSETILGPFTTILKSNQYPCFVSSEKAVMFHLMMTCNARGFFSALAGSASHG